MGLVVRPWVKLGGRDRGGAVYLYQYRVETRMLPMGMDAFVAVVVPYIDIHIGM